MSVTPGHSVITEMPVSCNSMAERSSMKARTPCSRDTLTAKDPAQNKTGYRRRIDYASGIRVQH